MNKYINLFLTLGLVIGLSHVFAQERVLRLADDKKYEMFFVNVQFRDDRLPSDSIQGKFIINWDRDLSFLIDDSVTIQMLKDRWVGERVDQMYGCWYDYFIYLVEDGVIVDELRVNEKCKQVITKHGIYNYSDSTTLRQIDRSKSITVADVTFESIELGRNFVNDALENQSFYVPGIDDKDWYKYGGSMIVKTKRRNIDKQEAKIKNLITEKFPGESFEVWFLTCNDRNCIFDVYCSELLGTSLKDLEIYREWSRFDPQIRLISKTEIRIREIVEKYAPNKN